MPEKLALSADQFAGSGSVRLAADLEARRLPDLAALRVTFAPDPAGIPHVSVHLATLASYEGLLGSTVQTGEVA
ncbi:hypothetical protein CRT23_26810 [Methylobacterium sp. V23]|nr:hypothetical protein CRT23_26810 [Methylobacterium sp. V23]